MDSSDPSAFDRTIASNRFPAGILPGIKKIAVLRANAVGDFIFALPALEALRAAYPRAEIVLLGQPWHAAFLEGRPGPIDRVIVVPPSKGVRDDHDSANKDSDPVVLERFFAAMCREQFDLAIQLHGGGRHSNPFLLRLGARTNIGLKSADAAPLDGWVPYLYFQPEIARYLEVVSLVGAKPLTLTPHLALTERDLAESYRAVPQTDQPLVVLHPGAGDPRRRWPPKKFAAVGDALVRMGAKILVNGTSAERHLVDAILDAMSSEPDSIYEKVSLGGLVGVLSRCRLIVSNDSGPVHLAAAVGTPTVGIYWCGNYMLAAPMNRTSNRPIIGWRLNCPVCDVNTLKTPCEHRESFVADVSVEEVLAAAVELFSQSALDGRNATTSSPALLAR